MRNALLASLLLAVLPHGALGAKKGSKADDYQLMELTDDTLLDAIKEHSLILVNIGIPNCGPCDAISKKMRAAGKELRPKAPNVKLAKLTITSQESPTIATVVQGALTLRGRPRAC